MRILFITDSSIQGASFRYRVHQYIGALTREGFDCAVASPRHVSLHRIARLCGYDIVFVQKKLFPVPWVLGASLFAKSLVFDFDDAIWTCPKLDWTPATRAKVHLRLRAMLAKSSCVIVGNEYLAEYARRFCTKVVVIPTCVDTDYYRPARPRLVDGKVRVGWIGSKPNLIYLEGLEPVFAELSRIDGISLVLSVVCDQEYRSRNLPTEFASWSLESEVEALHRFDIGVMPLADDEWTRGKCGFKTLQYMACGIPSVSSRVGINTEFVDDGLNGFLAGGEDEWVEKLSLLARDSGLRTRMGREGRYAVEARYSARVGAALMVEAMKYAGCAG